MQLQLDAQLLGTDLDLSLETGPSPADATISLRAQQDGTVLSRLDARSSRGQDGVWTWQLDGGVDIGPLAAWLAAPDVRAALELEPAALDRLAQLQPGGSVTAIGTLAHGDRVEPANVVRTLSANIDIGGQGLHLQPADDGHTLRGSFTGQLALNPGQVRLALSASEAGGSVPSEQLGLSAQARETLGWGAVSQVSWRQAGPATLAMGEDGQFTLTLTAGTLQAGSGGAELTIALLETAAAVRPGAPTRPQLDTAFTLNGRLRDKPLPPVSGSISLADQAGGDDQALSLLLSEPAGTLSVAVNGSGAPLDGKGQYQASARLAQAAGAVARYLPLLPPGAAPPTVPVVRAGSVDFSATVGAKGWGTPQHWQWRSQLNANGLALTYDTYTVDGLSLQAAWRGLEQWQTTRPALVSAERIDVGFPIEQLSAQLSLPSPTPPGAPDLRLESLQMTLLGGRAFLPEPQAWNFDSQRNSLAVQVEDLSLADIVALQQNPRINAEGRLSGRLPVSLNGPRLTIDRGYVKAAPGGVIRYRPDEASAALAGSSRELGMAIRLLGNFHYDVLSSEVALDEGGILLLGLSLAGRNPEYEGGRAVNFNINLEQNIDPLLQSLRLGGSVSKQLEKKRR